MKKETWAENYNSREVMSVRPNGILVYELRTYLEPKARNTTFAEWFGNTPEKKNQIEGGAKYSGILTPFARKKLKKAIELLIAMSTTRQVFHVKHKRYYPFRIGFITLTLPSAQNEITDKQIKSKCLDLFFKRMRRKGYLKNYVWRAERQKNKNIHFHMLTDSYIPHAYLQNCWNECINKLGFVDRFKDVHGHANPNSTDVHSVKKVKDLARYITKYMSKKTTEQDIINGKLWDCSSNLKTKDKCEFESYLDDSQVWENALKMEGAHVIHEDSFSMICLNERELNFVLSGFAKERYEEYLHRRRADIVQV